MDFKGIAWAGNIYQKFETMCMEVEEVMYQDTVKYMENQVQKVGGSVKKFYSEVMQDLLPLSSCVEPVKVAAASHNLDTEDKEDEGESIFDAREEKESPKKTPSYSIRSLSKTSHGPAVLEKRPESFSVRAKKTGPHKPLGIKRISRNNDTLEAKNSSAVKGNISTCETPLETPSPEDKDLSAESLRQEKGDPKNTSVACNGNTLADSVVRGFERASVDASGCILPTESTGANVISDALNVESENDYYAVTSNEDDPEEEISEPIERSNLDESCVFIEGSPLIQHVPEGTMKNRSYKQKIHKGFLSKLRSTKKQHRLVSEYKDLGGKKPLLDTMCSEKRTDDAVESDWEIL